MNFPFSHRSDESEQRYWEAKNEGTLISLHDEPSIKEFKYFRVIENRFELDGTWDGKTQMLMINRKSVARESEMTVEEKRELVFIKEMWVSTRYDSMLENFKRRSVGDIWHAHLVNDPEERR